MFVCYNKNNNDNKNICNCFYPGQGCGGSVSYSRTIVCEEKGASGMGCQSVIHTYSHLQFSSVSMFLYRGIKHWEKESKILYERQSFIQKHTKGSCRKKEAGVV